MKILLLTQWFDPEPTFKGLLFAQALRDEGHEVEVLTGFPNYPGGKVYEGYKIRAYQKDIVDGITIHRAPLYPSHDGSAIKRVFNYLSFAISTFFIGLILLELCFGMYTSRIVSSFFFNIYQVKNNFFCILGLVLISIALIIGMAGYLSYITAYQLKTIRILLSIIPLRSGE